jgi:hypothetical protein
VTEKDYSGTPLPRKLGIKEGHSVAFQSEPPGFRDLLQPLPPGVEIRERARGPLDVVVLFATRRSELERRFGPLTRAIDRAGGFWVVWPKKSSRIENDLSFDIVQRIGLVGGLVDNKSASIDAEWQGLRFVVRKEDRASWPIVLKRPTRG